MASLAAALRRPLSITLSNSIRPHPIRLCPIHPPLRLAHSIPRPPISQQRSNNSSPSSPSSRSSPSRSADTLDDRPTPRGPAYYQLSFTCVPCGHRSHHNVSKQGYHHGSTLITCPGCRNRHVISDHLGIFGDRSFTIEDLMREKGQLVKRGSLGEDGDIEFWPDENT